MALKENQRPRTIEDFGECDETSVCEMAVTRPVTIPHPEWLRAEPFQRVYLKAHTEESASVGSAPL